MSTAEAGDEDALEVEVPGRLGRGYAWALQSIGLGLLAVLFFHVGPGRVREVIGNCDPWLLIAALMLGPLMLSLRGVRWWVLCSGLGITLRPIEALRLYFAAAFLGSITPARMGDFSRAYLVRRSSPQSGLARGLASVLYDRLFDFAQLSVVALGLVAIVSGVKHSGSIVVATASIGLVAATTWPCRRRLLSMPLEALMRRLSGRRNLVLPTLTSSDVVKAHALGAAATACFVGLTVSGARGLGIGTEWFELAFLTAGGALIGLVPISILGIGTRDALFVAVAPSLNVGGEQLLSLSLLLLGVHLFNTAVGWVVWSAFRTKLGPVPSHVDTD